MARMLTFSVVLLALMCSSQEVWADPELSDSSQQDSVKVSVGILKALLQRYDVPSFDEFDRDAQIMDDDVCSLPSDPGPCNGYFSRYSYDSSVGQCTKFTYGGCGGNANNFKTGDECRRACSNKVCQLPAKRGPCKGMFTKYYFDASAGSCEEFVYGGCKANANIFQSREECQELCGDFMSPRSNVCDLPKDSGVRSEGDCSASRHSSRFYYNSRTERCTRFIYRGCGGNENNFSSRQECIDHCASSMTAQVQEVELESSETDAVSQLTSLLNALFTMKH